ncbi:MAG: hypothetical protein ACR2K9_05705 [Solirubrobacteraceae bacterium]
MRATRPASTGEGLALPPRIRSYCHSSRKELIRLSFNDEADRPRAARGARRASGGGSRQRPPADQQVLVRRWVLLGIGVVLLILLILGVKGCVDSSAKQALKNYNQDVGGIVGESDSKVSKPLFEQLKGAAGRNQRPSDAQNSINDLRVEADRELSRAADLSVPDKVKEAQRELLLLLELRRDGVAQIAEQLQPALGANGGPAITRIAGEMRRFDASDVLFSTRVLPLIDRALKAKDISSGPGGELLPHSKFLPDIGWLDAEFVSSQLGASGGSAGGRRGKPAAGTHGHALTSVSVGSATLQQGTTTSVPASPAPTFDVKFLNGGVNDETGVQVKISVEGPGKPIVKTKTLPRSPAGKETTVSISLGQSPPTGQAVTVKATVEKVPGETKSDNNTQTYSVLFTGG